MSAITTVAELRSALAGLFVEAGRVPDPIVRLHLLGQVGVKERVAGAYDKPSDFLAFDAEVAAVARMRETIASHSGTADDLHRRAVAVGGDLAQFERPGWLAPSDEGFIEGCLENPTDLLASSLEGRGRRAQLSFNPSHDIIYGRHLALVDLTGVSMKQPALPQSFVIRSAAAKAAAEADTAVVFIHQNTDVQPTLPPDQYGEVIFEPGREVSEGGTLAITNSADTPLAVLVGGKGEAGPFGRYVEVQPRSHQDIVLQGGESSALLTWREVIALQSGGVFMATDSNVLLYLYPRPVTP